LKLVRLGATAVVLVAGIAAWLMGYRDAATTAWTAGLVVVGSLVVVQTLRGMFRGRFAADVVASMAIIGAFAIGQPFAGLVIVVMQTGGEALEALLPRQPGLRAVVAIDGNAAGYVEYADRVRPEMRSVIDRFRALGVQHVMLLSGDATVNVQAVAAEIGIEEA